VGRGDDPRPVLCRLLLAPARIAAPPPLAVGPGDGRPFILPTRGQGMIMLGTADTGGMLSVFEVALEPGEGPGVHVHGREHEVWYVLEGEFRFLLGDTLVEQQAGGLAFGPIGTPHTFQNVGTGIGRLLVVTGPSGLEDFFLTYDREASGHGDAGALRTAACAAGLTLVGPPLAAR
jgi:mannose-6-phosphate isomerase-like protein (cupin superfamily)